MRVLLINPSYPFEEFPRLLVTLPYVASALRAQGHEVEILDLLLSRTTPEKIERRMSRFRPQVVGITSVTLNQHIAASWGCGSRGQGAGAIAEADVHVAGLSQCRSLKKRPSAISVCWLFRRRSVSDRASNSIGGKLRKLR